MNSVSTQVHLRSRPTGWPTERNFSLETVSLQPPRAGEVRVRNEYISVDPYMRGRMNDVKSYIPPFALNEVMTGGAVGRVVESSDDALSPGDAVLHFQGWRDVAQGPAEQFTRLSPESPDIPLSAYLGVLGLTGLTAYVGLLTIAEFTEGDTVFVSGAAGAVGSIVGQIAKIKGAGLVVGSAGSADKVRRLTDSYGFDAGFNYHDGPVRDQLADAAPDGIDVYFDNVGGEHLEAAISRLRDGGRAALCGAISTYNSTERTPGPSNMANLVTRGLMLKGFTVGNYTEHQPEFTREMSGWLAAGRINWDTTVVEGIENAVEAFLGMMHGKNTGKMLVRTGAAD
ncbi:NADP-dependent oxidoreductase [Spelaeicoccus albus]|uniref:Enoyl reductase (ER) domain-containing protein n=1 Tax=Spelaeicoccus albus TaxID=1280376 RepID=A0A7Z0D5R1_9MICO|nr:NADP-dependent oxidoreductase [Spelaeicoccus albus]NYI69405.1 hypothetical protein [Spelaeicoccus albus]